MPFTPTDHYLMTQIHQNQPGPSAQPPPSPPLPPIVSEINIECPFTSCRARLFNPKVFDRRKSLRHHLNRLYLKVPALWATDTVAQHNVLRFRPEKDGMHVCRRCMQLQASPCT